MTKTPLILALGLCTGFLAACTPDQASNAGGGPATAGSTVMAGASSAATAQAMPESAVGTPSAAHPNHVAYDCDDGFRFTADVAPEQAVIHMNGRDITMAHVISGSGARFKGETLTYWSKGRDATLQKDGEPARQCHERSMSTRS